MSRVRRVSSVSRKALLFFYQCQLGVKRLFRKSGLSEKSEKVSSRTRRASFFYETNIKMYGSSE